MTTHLCPHGHIAKIDPTIYEGWAWCATCRKYFNRGELGDILTDADRQRDLADAEMMLAALEADPTLESTLAAMSYDDGVQWLKERQQ